MGRHEEIFNIVRDYTMTTFPRIRSLIDAVDYVTENEIQGDFVECGVWRGGSVMAMALSLKHPIHERCFWLYDSFELGMSKPDIEDGKKAINKYEKKSLSKTPWHATNKNKVSESIQNITKLNEKKFNFVSGFVSQTIPKFIPKSISILRLDIDWYAPTLHVLTHLYPLLSRGGVIIIDDYGHWPGCKKAVGEYFDKSMFFIHVDNACVFAVKI